jgi:hypothetical protein
MLSRNYWGTWDERRASYLRYKAERAKRISESDKKQRRQKAAMQEAAAILASDLDCDLGNRDTTELHAARTAAALQRLHKRFRARRDPEQQAALTAYLEWALKHWKPLPPKPALQSTISAPQRTGWAFARTATFVVERRKRAYFATPTGTIVRYRWSDGTYNLSADESDLWEPPPLTAEQRINAVRCKYVRGDEPGPPSRSISDDAILEASW